MSPPLNAEEESRRLQAVAQETRLRVVETELALAMTWCSVAATEANLGEAKKFQESLARIKRAVASLQQRINEPAHVPTQLAPEFREKLRLLEVQVEKLDKLSAS